MEFRRNAQRQERRRRVLIDEARHDGARSGGARPASRATDQEACNSYSEAARRIHQPPVTTLLPTGVWTTAIIALLGLCAIVGLEAAYGSLQLTVVPISAAALETFDLLQADSIAGWLTCAMFSAMALLGSLIYLLRRHRVDDYRGRYRAWLWLAPLAAVASLESVAGLRRAGGEWMAIACGLPADAHGTTCRLVGMAVITALAVTRLAIEMRRYWPALVPLAAAAVGYAIALAEAAWHGLPDSIFRTMFIGGLLLTNHWCLLLSILLYGRQVQLEADGLVKPRDCSRKSAEQRPAATATDVQTTNEAPQPAGQPTSSAAAVTFGEPSRAPVRAVLKAAAPETDEPADESPAGGAKLSKSERRRLKKEARRQAAQAARS